MGAGGDEDHFHARATEGDRQSARIEQEIPGQQKICRVAFRGSQHKDHIPLAPLKAFNGIDCRKRDRPIWVAERQRWNRFA